MRLCSGAGLPRRRHELIIKRFFITNSAVTPDIVEWFAEWSGDTRGNQRGLLLLTAHRAKGLEFNNVVILDGGWKQAWLTREWSVRGTIKCLL